MRLSGVLRANLELLGKLGRKLAADEFFPGNLVVLDQLFMADALQPILIGSYMWPTPACSKLLSHISCWSVEGWQC